jgi:hypothetical protein
MAVAGLNVAVFYAASRGGLHGTGLDAEAPLPDQADRRDLARRLGRA